MTRIQFSEIGILGEIRIPEKRLTPTERALIRDHFWDYVHFTNGLIVGRNPRYYQPTTIAQSLDMLTALNRKYDLLCFNNIDSPFLKFVYLDWAMCLAVRTYDRLVTGKEDIVTEDCQISNWCSQFLDFLSEEFAYMFGFSEAPSSRSIGPVQAPDSSQAGVDLRSYIEMDNKILLALRCKLLEGQLPRETAIMSPLLGGGLVAPILAACLKLRKWRYTKFSIYDETRSEIPVFIDAKNIPASIGLIDDNIGTSATLSTIKDHLLLSQCSTAYMTSIELNWTRHYASKNEGTGKVTFDIDKIDYLSPFNYRNYKKMEAYIKQYEQYGILSDLTLADHLGDCCDMMRHITKLYEETVHHETFQNLSNALCHIDPTIIIR